MGGGGGLKLALRGHLNAGAQRAVKECLSMHSLVILCVANKCEPHVESLVWQPIRV